MSIIYGVDTEKVVTAEMARDAVIECFYDAHCAQTEMSEASSPDTKNYCFDIVTKAFSETNGDINNPTKLSLLAILPWLAKFSASFRDQETIKRHFSEINGLIGLIKD